MYLNEALLLREERASSFDYRYWFWAKEGASTYGFGYARQEIKVDISVAGDELRTSIENIKDVLSKIESGNTDDLEIVDKKIKVSTKRMSTIIELFGSPIVIHWFNKQKPSLFSIPSARENDVVDSKGRRIDVYELFTDSDTSEFVTTIMDWDKVKINDSQGDTINTIIAKFIKDVFSKESKNVRSTARNYVSKIMSNIKFYPKSDVKIVSFKEEDYDLLPKEYIGSKKIVTKINEILDKNFNEILNRARMRT
mgnify:CR=1 FL=1